MDNIKISEDIDHHRRRFVGAAVMTVAAAQFGMVSSANAQAVKASAKELPAIWEPNADYELSEVRNTLRGVAPQNPFANMFPEYWYYVKG